MVVPSVAQQLAAIRHTIAKTIIPALAADADFEREQAGLVLASLDWAMDVVDSEYGYEQVEHADQHALLASLLAVDAAAGPTDATALLDAAAAPPAGLVALREQTRALKTATDATFTALGDSDAARELLSRAARRQTERELAWTRMTGFPKNAPAVADVLSAQAGEPRA